MKRVWLLNGGGDRDVPLFRRAAVALASYATNGAAGRDVGDPVHEEVTEGRRKQYEVARDAGAAWAQPPHTYSSCGDLPHWLLRCLGCRDESLVNRNDDGGAHPWASGTNISRLRGSPYVVTRFGPEDAPRPGDAVFVMNPSGGHVCVVESWDEAAGVAVTHDYGQPYARQRAKTIARQADGRILLAGFPVLWWLDVSLVPTTESAAVPDDFDGGTPDDNPYPEPGVPELRRVGLARRQLDLERAERRPEASLGLGLDLRAR